MRLLRGIYTYEKERIYMEALHLKPVQKAALSLIQSDLRFLYTVIERINPNESNYIPSLLPYMGIVIDGAEEWVKAINNSSKVKLEIPLFSESEQVFYEKMRNSIKMWQNDYSTIYDILKEAYYISDDYFGNICKPIAKKMKLYDIFGVDRANGIICGNTILCYYYTPSFSYDGNYGEYIRAMSVIGGKYIKLFDATKEYPVDTSMKYDVCDYGGFVKSPVGNAFSDKFVLFSVLCQINFIICCVDSWVREEISTKMRFAYLLYYSLLHIIPQINLKLNTNLVINSKWESWQFRNAMAHYKLGIALKDEELFSEDKLFGLTHKYFELDYLTVKKEIMQELESLACQIGDYLKLKDAVIGAKR